MRVPGLRRATLALRRARARWTPGAAILGYHRVAQAHDDPYRLTIAPANFAAQLAVLAARARPMPLAEVVRALRSGTLPPRAIAVTFDDGYADCLHVALPLLERHGIPATVFVATGYLGREFWWDTLARLLRSVADTGPLVLRVSGRDRVFDTADGTSLPERLYRLLRHSPPDELDAALDRLRAHAGVAAVAPNGRRALTQDELARLAASELIEIGAHTVSHPCLAGLPPGSLRDEVHASKSMLERISGDVVTSFSYPNGATSRAAVAVVREAGFKRACASTFGPAHPRSDRWRLPRLWAPDADAEAFDRWLALWLPRGRA